MESVALARVSVCDLCSDLCSDLCIVNVWWSLLIKAYLWNKLFLHGREFVIFALVHAWWSK